MSDALAAKSALATAFAGAVTGSVRIVERSNHLGWRVHRGVGHVDVQTAVEALELVRAHDRDAVESGSGVSVTVVTWEPRTRVGKAVVSALTNQTTR